MQMTVFKLNLIRTWNWQKTRQRAYKGRVPLIHVRYTPFFCVYCVPYNWSQVHKYTNIMDYVEMYDKNYGVQIVELE